MVKSSPANPPSSGQRTLFSFFNKRGADKENQAPDANDGVANTPTRNGGNAHKKASKPLEQPKVNIPSSPLAGNDAEGTNLSTPVRKYAISDDDSDPEDDDDKIKTTRRKRRKVSDDEGDDDEDFVPDKMDVNDDDDDDDALDAEAEAFDEDDDDGVDNDNDDSDVEMETERSNGQDASENLSKYRVGSGYVPDGSFVPPKSVEKHKKHGKFEKENEERYKWLIDIRDAEKRPMSDPDYDPRTLYIPAGAWKKFTPFEKQYWEVKSKMWDTVVFFKKGKFYELYEKDAMVAHNEFDLKLAGGGRANMQLAGVPEMSFDYWASAFGAKGYKVAKVDQKETALAKEMRGGGTKEEKVIKRELSYVLTSGTLMEETMLVDDMSTYCMAIKQDNLQFAVCFVDTAAGKFFVTDFEDDSDYLQFETLIAQTRPRELILEKGKISQRAVRILKNNTSPETLWNLIKPKTEFLGADDAYEMILKGGYFPGEDVDDVSQYPQIVQNMFEKPLLMSAFGGLMWYLQSLKIDKMLIPQGNFQTYETIKVATSMILDGQSLQNLEIFANTFDGTDEGTLFRLLNRCISAFGKRRLKEWICHPLVDVKNIEARLDSVDYLNSNLKLLDKIESRLSKLPDLERMMSRIHAKQIKVKDFVRVIEGFNTIYSLVADLAQHDEDLKGMLRVILNTMPDLDRPLSQWASSFDHEKAKSDNELIPEKGVEPEFDQSVEKMQGIEEQLNDHLKQYKKDLKSVEICFKDSGKEIYLIEVPLKCQKLVPKSWMQMDATSKVKRYWSPEVKKLVRQLQEAQELHKLVVEHVQHKMYEKFDQDRDIWLRVIQAVANIDCLVSLAKTSTHLGEPACRPQFVDSDIGQVHFEELRHPCYRGSDNFVPNDVTLGGEDYANMTLLTGANAAGKSTVLRMTCTAVIMAQIGCYVPASAAKLAPVDRIMTRLGANDNIFAGKSTFFVELSETKRILSEATPKSLLVIDELGRGGSSSDGFAIAEAVLHHLATRVGSLGFFATHYGTLYNSFETHPQVCAKQMDILVDEETKKVTFLYKLIDGVSPSSFGMNVARNCGIASSIVDAAEEAAKKFEHTSRMRKLMQVDSSAAANVLPLGLQSDFVQLVSNDELNLSKQSLDTILSMVKSL